MRSFSLLFLSCRRPWLALLIMLLAGITPLAGKAVAAEAANPSAVNGSTVQVLYVGFTPPVGVAQHIVQAIDQARKEVLVQAYGFTHNAIAQAVVRAHQRGLKVGVLLDEKSDSTNRYVTGLFRAEGLSMRLDGSHAIAHNKVIVIDGEVLVTGSFNFTNSAETRNAENLLILRGAALAQAYRDNFLQHWAHGRP
jgi:phosphatidylserine/phosphatidylglycerophosphate/cardiolipin synthase-like enzyme